MRRVQSISRRSQPREGSFLVITVASMFLILGFVALVADFGYTYAERQRTQGVLDMAGIATLVSVRGIDQDLAEASVDQILLENSVDPTNITSVLLTQEGVGVNLLVEATIPINSLFGTLYGFTQYPTALSSLTTATVELEAPLLSGFGMFSCSSMHINRTMWSYDSGVGPNEGPPVGFPTITSCAGGTNCGDRLLIGSNGDVTFDGATVYGNVVAGGSILYGMGAGNRISGDARAGAGAPGGISPSLVIGGQRLMGQPFAPIDCDESVHLPDHFLDHDGDLGIPHTHPGQGTYTPKREIELDDQADTETDGTGAPRSVVGGFSISTIKGPRNYTLGNRLGNGSGIANGTGVADEDILFHSAASQGNEYAGMMGPDFPMDPFNASEAGGWVWGKNDNVTANFRTGVTYFFHEMVLRGSKNHDFYGDWELDGPAVFFIHGNGQTNGGLDFSANNGNFRYLGQCGGMACAVGAQVPGLRLYATDDSVLDMKGNYEFAVDIMAPGAVVDMTGTSGVLGRVLADVIDMNGNSDFNFDVQLLEGDPNQPFNFAVRAARIVY